MKKAPYTLGGWSKTQSQSVRVRRAMSSRPKTWTYKRRALSAARALQALSNVTRDKQTKVIAAKDAGYFFKKVKKYR